MTIFKKISRKNSIKEIHIEDINKTNKTKCVVCGRKISDLKNFECEICKVKIDE